LLYRIGTRRTNQSDSLGLLLDAQIYLPSALSRDILLTRES